METTVSDEEFNNLEAKSRLSLTKLEYSTIKRYLYLEQYLNKNKQDIDLVDIDLRIIILITSAYGFYIDDNGNLNFSV